MTTNAIVTGGAVASARSDVTAKWPARQEVQLWLSLARNQEFDKCPRFVLESAPLRDRFWITGLTRPINMAGTRSIGKRVAVRRREHQAICMQPNNEGLA